MAASTLALLETSLKRVYSEEFFEAAYNLAAPFWNMLQNDIKNVENDGEGYYFPFYLQTPQNMGTPAEDANLPVPKQRTEVQGRIRPGQFIGTFEISFLLEAIGTARGSFNKSELKRHMSETMGDVTKHINRIFSATHGTGRIAQLDAATSSVNTFVAKIGGAGTAEPFGAHLLRPNMLISVYDDDTGAGGTEITARKITKIVQSTRTVTFDGAAATMDADDHVYIHGSYGVSTVPNGLMGLADDGSVLVTVHNQSRNTYEELKSYVDSSSSGLRQLSEEAILRACLTVEQLCGQQVDLLLMNGGMIEKYLAFVRPDRRYPVGPGGKGVPDYKTGYDEAALEFLWGGKRTKIVKMVDIPPRTIFGLTKAMLRRFTLKRLSWDEQGGGILKQGVDSSGYKTTHQATLVHFDNIGTYMPRALFRMSDYSDALLAGSAYGGSDT